MLLWVLKPKNLILPSALAFSAQALVSGIQFLDAADAMNEIEVNGSRCSSVPATG